MDNQTFQRIKDLVMQHQNIGVVVAPNSTLDTMAAGLGMFLALRAMGKQVVIASPSDSTVALSSLVGIDKVQKTLGGVGGDLTVTFPYNEGEIDKVSYTLENGQLNIVVKAGAKGISFTDRDVQFKRGGGAVPQLLFLIGVHTISDIGGIASSDDLKNTSIVNIDNSASNSGFGDIPVVSTKFSSHSEQVADFLTLLEPQIELDVDTSQNLLSGILFATEDFNKPNSSYLAFEMAGILMKKGATRKPGIGGGQPLPNNMPAKSFFPPAQQVPQMTAPSQPVQNRGGFSQPLNQTPIQEYSQTQAKQVGFGQGTVQQPMQSQEFIPQQGFQQPVMGQPLQQVPQPQAENQPIQPTGQIQNQPAPADWLTPKVYKGSTVL